MASIIDTFFKELDRRWKRASRAKIRLHIIGSSAIMLQTQYSRGTKDSDVLETAEITPEIEDELIAIGGKGSELRAKFRLYLDFVNRSLPFLPQKPRFHPVASLKDLKHFEILVLDVTDVAVSKFKRFNANDVSDIRALVADSLISHKKLVGRFKDAVDFFSEDARAEDMPQYVANLNTVERDFFSVPESEIDLPPWVAGD